MGELLLLKVNTGKRVEVAGGEWEWGVGEECARACVQVQGGKKSNKARVARQ